MIQLALDLSDETPEVAADYLTIAEAAARIRCHQRTIRRAIDSGDLRAGRIRTDRSKRGVFRIRLAYIEAMLEAGFIKRASGDGFVMVRPSPEAEAAVAQRASEISDEMLAEDRDETPTAWIIQKPEAED